MIDSRCCAVVPAAGRGSRLGIDVPKILAPLGAGLTVWDIVSARLFRMVSHIHVVVSPDGLPQMKAYLERSDRADHVSLSVQETPQGMGDAIFGAAPWWSRFENILVVWGDQIHLSEATLHATLTAQRNALAPHLTVPVVEVEHPYVQYLFNTAARQLIQVLETREGDQCASRGFSDVGTFCLSVDGLVDCWQKYLAAGQRGARTKEINFLPFLPYLSMDEGWNVSSVLVRDPQEARGINTPEDLAFFSRLYAKNEESV